MRARRTNESIDIGRRGPSMVAVAALVVSSLAVVVGAAPPVVNAERTTGEIVKYEFGDSPGSVVADTSGNGTPLNLTIADPSNVTWVPGGRQPSCGAERRLR